MTEDITVKPDQLHQLDANVLKLTIKVIMTANWILVCHMPMVPLRRMPC